MKLLISTIVFFMVMFAAAEAFACLCEPVKSKARVKEMKKNADAIFIGKVITVEGDHREKKVVLAVSKLWKGKNSGSFDIYTAATGCGVHFAEGRSFLVYAVADKVGRLATEVCMGSGAVELATEDVKRLGKPFSDNRSEFVSPK